MSACIEQVLLNVIDQEREIFYHAVETYNHDLQHKKVLQASQRMDQIIISWYQQQKRKAKKR